MITINKGLAGVIPDFIKQREMESRWQRSLSLFRNLYGSYGVQKPRPLLLHGCSLLTRSYHGSPFISACQENDAPGWSQLRDAPLLVMMLVKHEDHPGITGAHGPLLVAD